MRTIKFRGKDKLSGEWYYGNLYDRDTLGRTHISAPFRTCYRIDPNTVGEFTGLYDRTYKEIYEGDIVKVTSEAITYMARVIFMGGCFCLIARDKGRTFDGLDTEEIEIVGNAHDNPELLEKYRI